ncbi:MAG: dihydrofolate synthase [Streptosporangiales bacterium]|nr:dihydrofolate synthase [Streptosporangiales bacterium]
MTLKDVERELFARWPETQLQPSTERIRALMDLLGGPQHGYPVIHVTGTNGKTSTARMIDALLRARDLRVGRFTSPHLETIRERISVDGEPLDAEGFVGAYEDVRPYVEMVDASHEVPMSYFEVLTGMAYAAFAETPVDVAVVEVGMGGSWDATNVADGAVAVVTPIAIDHTRYLGNTVEQIAGEKAGIIKAGSTAVLAHQQVPVAEILLRRAAEVGSVVAREGLEFGVTGRDLAVGGQQLSLRGLRASYDQVFLPLFGAHQAGNAACALAAVEAFTGGEQELDPDIVRAGFADVRSPGRLERIRTSPAILVDATHNPAGMAATAEALAESFTFTRLVGVVAMMADKDVRGMLEALEPVLAEIVVTRNSSPRSMGVDELAGLAEEIFGPDRVHAAARLDDAVDQAVAAAEELGELAGAGVLVTGSVVTAGDARWLLARG